MLSFRLSLFKSKDEKRTAKAKKKNKKVTKGFRKIK